MSKPKPESKLMHEYFSFIQNRTDPSSLIIVKKRLSPGNSSYFMLPLPGILDSFCNLSHLLIDEIMILYSSAHSVLEV